MRFLRGGVTSSTSNSPSISSARRFLLSSCWGWGEMDWEPLPALILFPIYGERASLTFNFRGRGGLPADLDTEVQLGSHLRSDFALDHLWVRAATEKRSLLANPSSVLCSSHCCWISKRSAPHHGGANQPHPPLPILYLFPCLCCSFFHPRFSRYQSHESFHCCLADLLGCGTWRCSARPQHEVPLHFSPAGSQRSILCPPLELHKEHEIHLLCSECEHHWVGWLWPVSQWTDARIWCRHRMGCWWNWLPSCE